MHTVKLLTELVENYQVLAYLIIYLGLIVEGEFFLILSGILLHLGALNLYFTVCVVVLGVISKAVIGYGLGKLLFRVFNHHKFFQYIQKRVYLVFPKFKVKPFWSIFISKFIFGANNIVILFSGFEKINFKKFLRAEFSASSVWAPIVLSLGYFFSYTALSVSREIWKFLVVVISFYIVFVLFDKLVSWIFEFFEESYEPEN